jgi:hypothetical protein
MPNVVLEMSQHAIPMILSDAGGIRFTFDETSAFIIDAASELTAKVREYDMACDRLLAMSAQAQSEMTRLAYEHVRLQHAPSRFEAKVQAVLKV